MITIPGTTLAVTGMLTLEALNGRFDINVAELPSGLLSVVVRDRKTEEMRVIHATEPKGIVDVKIPEPMPTDHYDHSQRCQCFDCVDLTTIPRYP